MGSFLIFQLLPKYATAKAKLMKEKGHFLPPFTLSVSLNPSLPLSIHISVTHELPVCSFHCLIPVLKSKLQLHLLHKSRQEVGVADDHLIDQLQGPTIVVTELKEFGFAKKGTDISGSVTEITWQGHKLFSA